MPVHCGGMNIHRTDLPVATRRTGRMLVEFDVAATMRIHLVYAGGRGGFFEVMPRERVAGLRGE